VDTNRSGYATLGQLLRVQVFDSTAFAGATACRQLEDSQLHSLTGLDEITHVTCRV
jgi:hypothetical protein